MTTTAQDFPQVWVTVVGGRVDLYDEAGDKVRTLDPVDALALADAINDQRAAIESLTERKQYVEQVVRALHVVTTGAQDTPLSFDVRSGKVTAQLRDVETLLTLAEHMGEPVMVTLRESDVYPVNYTVHASEGEFCAIDGDVSVAALLSDREPVSA